MDLRDVFDDPNDDGITEAIAEAEAEAQRECQEEEAEAVAGQYMAEAMNIPLSDLSVGSSTESAKDARRERHVSKKFTNLAVVFNLKHFDHVSLNLNFEREKQNISDCIHVYLYIF